MLAVVGAAVGFTCSFAAGPAGAAPNAESVSVPATAAWTNTGIRVQAGETIVIEARGRVRFRAPASMVGPEGVAWGTQCDRENTAKVAAAWPASGTACWSLIGRVGAGKPFAIGRAADVTAPASGELQLGINDNYIEDNAGAWTASLSVVSAARASSAMPPPPQASKHSSNVLLFAIVGLVAVLAIIGLVLLVRRARRRPTEDEELVAAAAASSPTNVVPLPAASAVVLAPTADEQTVVPSEYDATKVNIFEVTLTTALLRVGYSHFPESVEVRWSVRRGVATLATGTFVTNGGGDTEHYVSFPIELPRADGRETSVEFHWSMDDVPFAYSVRRDPADNVPRPTLE